MILRFHRKKNIHSQPWLGVTAALLGGVAAWLAPAPEAAAAAFSIGQVTSVEGGGLSVELPSSGQFINGQFVAPVAASTTITTDLSVDPTAVYQPPLFVFLTLTNGSGRLIESVSLQLGFTAEGDSASSIPRFSGNSISSNGYYSTTQSPSYAEIVTPGFNGDAGFTLNFTLAIDDVEAVQAGADLTLDVAANYAATVAPEPGTAAALLVGITLVCRTRPRRYRASSSSSGTP